jgi:undecaprenyl-diphosphatase
MTVFESLILGIVQGVTEFIPVSSSGHLTLFGKIFDLDPELMMSFTTMLHVGTLIAVFVVMRKEILAIIKDIFGPRTWQLVIATVPAVIAALLLGDWFESLFDGRTLGYQFLMTGVILLSTLMIKTNRDHDTGRIRKVSIDSDETMATEKESKEGSLEDPIEASTDNQPAADPYKDVSYKEALVAGIGQAVAIMPGISRSGATLASLLFCKVNRKKAIRFSFLMSIPAIAGGFVLDMLKMFKGEGSALTDMNIFTLLIGVAAAAVSGYLAMNFMLRKLNAKGLLSFAAYVIVVGLIVLIDQTWLHIVFK